MPTPHEKAEALRQSLSKYNPPPTEVLPVEEPLLSDMDDDTLGFTASLVAECMSNGLPYDEGAVVSLLTECADRLRGR